MSPPEGVNPEGTLMYLHIGNDEALRSYRDPKSNEPDEVLYEDHPGEWVTELLFPEGITLVEAFRSTLEAMTHHIQRGAKPKWVEGDNEALVSLLVEEWGISDNTRPPDWGQNNPSTT